MSEETKTETPETEQTKTGKPETEQAGKKQVIFESQADVDKMVESRLAQERKKYQDYDTVKSELDQLTKEKTEREESELSEVEKLKTEIEKKDQTIEDLGKHKTFHDDYIESETAKVDEAMKDFSDEDKELVSDVPLEKRMIMINKLKAQTETTTTGVGFDSKGERGQSKTFDEKVTGAKSDKEMLTLLNEAKQTPA